MVSFTFATVAAAVTLFAQTAVAAPSPIVDASGVYAKRAASCTFPTPSKTIVLSTPKVVSGTFDGELTRFNRGGGACVAQTDAGDVAVVFVLENGATIKNVVIGANQVEGIRCRGSCNIYNVWFEDVCENAITIAQTSGTSNIVGGGAKGASDNVIQHNGGGSVVIDSYCVKDFGKLYRSCGNCKTQYKRSVTISNVIAQNGNLLAGVNSNYGDVATIKTSTNSVSGVKSACDTFQAFTTGREAIKLTSNEVNSSCQF